MFTTHDNELLSDYMRSHPCHSFTSRICTLSISLLRRSYVSHWGPVFWVHFRMFGLQCILEGSGLIRSTTRVDA